MQPRDVVVGRPCSRDYGGGRSPEGLDSGRDVQGVKRPPVARPCADEPGRRKHEERWAHGCGVLGHSRDDQRCRRDHDEAGDGRRERDESTNRTSHCECYEPDDDPDEESREAVRRLVQSVDKILAPVTSWEATGQMSDIAAKLLDPTLISPITEDVLVLRGRPPDLESLPSRGPEDGPDRRRWDRLSLRRPREALPVDDDELRLFSSCRSPISRRLRRVHPT